MENTKNKKILIFLHKFPFPDFDSTKFRILNSVILPLKKNFEIKIFIVTYEKINNDDLNFLKNIAPLEFYIFPKWRFVLNILLNCLSLRPYQTEMFFFKNVFLRFRKIAEEYDIIYVHTIRLGKYIEKLPIGLRKKIILDFNDSIALHYLKGWRYYPLLLKIPILFEGIKLFFYEKKLFKIFENFCIVSEFDKNFILRNIPHDIVQKKNFLTTFVSVKNYKQEHLEVSFNKFSSNPYICFMGNLKYYPNYEGLSYFLQNIWPHIKEELKDLEFLIIGKVDKKFINRFKSFKGVKFLNFVDNPYSIIKNSIAFVSPVRIGAGIQAKIVEVMGMGHIVIAYEQGVNEIDGFRNLENIIICKSNKWSEWLKWIKFVLENKVEVKKIKEKCKEFVAQNFYIERVGEKYLQLVKNILDSTKT